MNRSTRNNSNHGHGNRHMTGRILALLLALSMTVSLGVDVSSLQAYATNNDGVIENVENQEGNGGSDEDAAPTDLADGDDNEVPDEEPQETTEAGNTGDNGDDNHDADAQEPSDEQDETDDSNKEETGETKTDEDANKDQSADDKADSKDDDADNKDEESDELDEIVTPDARFDVEDDETIPNDDYDADYIEAADDAVDSENKLASLIAVAQSQVGYTQQILDETKDTVYTLYGNWYDSENTYDDWSAVFAAYCLDKAGFDVTKDEIEDESTALPIRDSLSAWEDAMDDAGWYMTSAAGVSLTAGDIAFLDLDRDGDADHIGIITSVEGGDNEPTTGFRAVIGDLDADTKANFYEVGDEDKSVAASVQEISFPGDREDVDDAEDYMASLLTGYVGVASYLDYVENGNNGADEPKTIPDSTVDFKGNITKATMQKLVNGYWVDATEFDDDDQIKVNIEYAFDDTNNVTPGTSITYQLPDGVQPNMELHGKVTGYVNNTYYADLGDYTIDQNGKITITFNDTFHKTEGAFTGTIEFSGTAQNESTENDKEVKFTENGTGYIIKKKQIDEDLTIKKSGSKKTGEKTVNYTVVVESKNGTGTDPVKIVDTVYPSGLNLSQVEYTNIKVVDQNGNVITVGDSQIKKETGDNYKKLTVTDLPALPAGGKYTITYDINYGATIGNGEATLNNNVHGFKGNEDKGNSSAYITIAGKMIEKKGAATDNNSAVLWTITVNPSKSTNVAGTYNLKDYLNGSTSMIDWSKVEDLKVEKQDQSWQTTNVTSTIGAEIKSNNTITIENGCTYYITYKTKVEGKAGETIKEKNKIVIDKEGEEWEDEGDVDVTKPDWKVGKTGTGVKEDEGSETATAGWSSTVTLPLQDDNTTGFGSEGLLFQDWILTIEDKRDDTVHYSTPSIIESSLVVKLDNKQLDKSEYTIVYYDENKNEITPSSDVKITGFGVKVKGPKTGATMTFSYNTKMVIKNLKDGESLTVKNTSEVNGKTSSATQTYKKKNPLIKNSSGTPFSTPIVDSTGETTVNFNAIDGKLYYRIVVYPNSTTGSTLTDVIPEGLTLKAENVKIQMTTGAHNIYTEFWYSDYHFNLDEVEGQKPTVTVDGQKLTVKFPDISKVHGYGQADNVYPSTNIFDGTLGYVVDYWVDVTDEFWEDLKNTEKTYRNTASWNSKTTTQETKIERTTPVIAKEGEQQKREDGKGSDTIRYYVTINAAGATLNDGKEITLTDNLADNSYGIKLELDLKSVKLYMYDGKNTDNHCIGEQMSQNSYTFKYDNTTNTFTAGIPDATPCVLVYDYIVKDWNNYAQEASLINDVTLEGKDKSSESSETKIKAADSSATVKKANTLKLIKVDSQRYQKVLPEAKFAVYSYDPTTHEWNRFGSYPNATYSSNANGELQFDTDQKSTDLGSMATNTLYKIVEVEAPSGYSLPDTYTPYYFVMLADGTTADAFWNTLGSVADYNPDKTSETKTVTKNNVTFVEHNGVATIYAPNRYSSIEVEKLWVDENGNRITDYSTLPESGKEIKVQLYQQKTKAESWTVTVNSKTSGSLYVDTSIYTVAKGSAFNLYYKYGSNGTFNVVSSTGDNQSVTGGTYQAFTNQEAAKYSIEAVNEDITLDVTSNFEWSLNWKSIIAAEYTEPSSYIGDGDAAKYGEEKTLNKDNSWKATWSNLPVVDDDGNPYYYTVKEVTTGQDWTVTYNNNAGIQTGIIEVVNHTIKRYTMPETGGTGTLPYEAAGSIAILGAMFYTGYSRRKRKGGQV